MQKKFDTKARAKSIWRSIRYKKHTARSLPHLYFVLGSWELAVEDTGWLPWSDDSPPLTTGRQDFLDHTHPGDWWVQWGSWALAASMKDPVDGWVRLLSPVRGWLGHGSHCSYVASLCAPILRWALFSQGLQEMGVPEERGSWAPLEGEPEWAWPLPILAITWWP